MILVTGATGNVGRHLVRLLRERGEEVREASRSLGTDVTDPDALRAAAEGTDRVFLLWPNADPAAIPAAAEALSGGGARRIVHLSAEGRPMFHGQVEDAVTATGSPAVFLRAGGFAANALVWADQLRGGDVVEWPFARAGRSLVHEADLAAVAARALTDPDLEGPTPMLTGPAVITQEDQVAAIGAATGRALAYREIPPEAARERLLPVLGEHTDPSLAYWASLVADPEPVSTGVEDLLGRPATPFEAWARDHAADFSR